MSATTNNEKIINKEYLEEQFYFYDKNFVDKKQNIIHSISDHVSLIKDGDEELDQFSLSLNIINDEERKNNDYLISSKSDNNTLKWETPLNTDSNVNSGKLEENNDKLITAKTLNYFEGTTRITKLGTIIEGEWNGGSATINGNLAVSGDFKMSKNSIASGEKAEYTNIETTIINAKDLNVSGSANIENLNIDNTTINKNGIETNYLNVTDKTTIGSVEKPSSLKIFGTLEATGLKTDSSGNLNIDGEIVSKSIKTENKNITINLPLSLNSNMSAENVSAKDVSANNVTVNDAIAAGTITTIGMSTKSIEANTIAVDKVTVNNTITIGNNTIIDAESLYSKKIKTNSLIINDNTINIIEKPNDMENFIEELLS